jgi:hypothetical protein
VLIEPFWGIPNSLIAPFTAVYMRAMGVDNVDEAYQIALDAGFKPLIAPKFAPQESTPKKITLNVAFVTGPDGEEVEFFRVV